MLWCSRRGQVMAVHEPVLLSMTLTSLNLAHLAVGVRGSSLNPESSRMFLAELTQHLHHCMEGGCRRCGRL